MQDNTWTKTRLGNNTTNDIGHMGCKATAAAKVVSSLLDTEMNPNDIVEGGYTTSYGGTLSQNVVRALNDNNTNGTRYFTTGTISDPTQATFESLYNSPDKVGIMAKTRVWVPATADEPAHWSEHWIAVEGYYVKDGKVILRTSYTSNGDQNNKREYTLDTEDLSKNIHKVTEIEIYRENKIRGTAGSVVDS